MEVRITPGQLVEPKAGRDSGRFYLVIEVVDGKYVLAVDGMARRLENPKKKNIRHLIVHPQIAGEIVDKLKSGERISNAEIRKAILRLVSNAEEPPL